MLLCVCRDSRLCLQPYISLCALVLTSQGPEAEEKWCWSTFCKFIVITGSQGYCTGLLSRSNCPCDLHMTWLWPFASSCPEGWNWTSHDCCSLSVSNRLHISVTMADELKPLPSFSRVVNCQSVSASLQCSSCCDSTLNIYFQFSWSYNSTNIIVH